MPDEVRELEKIIATKTLERDDLAADIDRLLTDFLGKKLGTVSGRVEKMDGQITRLNSEIRDLQQKLEDNRSQLDHSHRQAAIMDLRQRMRDATGPEKFAIRAKVAHALNEVIEQMRFHPNGFVEIRYTNKEWLTIFDQNLEPISWQRTIGEDGKPTPPKYVRQGVYNVRENS
jgi:chromosome segregation ATPase